MYLFVFLWVPSLQDAGGANLPLGYIFSAFMISMMLGSIVYTTIATTAKVSSTDTGLPTNGHANGYTAPRTEELDSLVVLHAKLAALVCGVASLLFAYSATGSSMSAENRFWAFCAFEACVGMYYPVMGMLRGTLVANEVRATVSSASFDCSSRLSRMLTDGNFVFLAKFVGM
jgi:MFS transporter, MFS domain-containing protein family, molybdate-anion transporter